MNAWIQRCWVGLKMLLSLLALAWVWHGGNMVCAALLVALVFGLDGVVMLGSFCSLLRINAGAGALRIAPMLGSWLREWWACERVFSWQQPFEEHRYPDNLPLGAAERGVLLLHGFTCNRGLWNPWMKRLREQHTPYVALTLEPAFGSIDAYAEQIEIGVQNLLALSGQPPVIVAHSMGGLAVRAWLRRFGHARRGTAPVAHIMTLGSPHAGTLMANFLSTVNAKQMRRGSTWLAALDQAESVELASEFTCYFSNFDQVVCPASTAILPGCQATEVAGSGHLSLLFEPRIFADLLRLLNDKRP
jgi:pimeloyl-ACP methyl ester carboxylesterase